VSDIEEEAKKLTFLENKKPARKVKLVPLSQLPKEIPVDPGPPPSLLIPVVGGYKVNVNYGPECIKFDKALQIYLRWKRKVENR
jgi:hypothetical protein